MSGEVELSDRPSIAFCIDSSHLCVCVCVCECACVCSDVVYKHKVSSLVCNNILFLLIGPLCNELIHLCQLHELAVVHQKKRPPTYSAHGESTLTHTTSTTHHPHSATHTPTHPHTFVCSSMSQQALLQSDDWTQLLFSARHILHCVTAIEVLLFVLL